ncbi:MAG TPA: ABC transporter permease [Candidatus Paceibacterota bacterium]|jgi:ABC-type transport system involved in multi-copper enzyme maturation permease subunit|nr:ABC transporter permease [Candidatus Paceibacterota bacterium]
MRNIWTIARNTFKLEVRDKILYGIIIFAILYIFFEIFLGDLVLKELPMVKSFGLTGIYFFNAIIALFLGTTSFFKDIDRKVVYFIISKPVSRAQFLLGKFFGLCLVLLMTTAVLAVAYIALIAYEQGGFDVLGLAAIFMQYLEMALFLAFAIFVSTFSSSLLSIVYTSAVFFLGHIVSALIADAQAVKITGVKFILVEIFYYVFPNLEKFDVRNLAIHDVATPALSVVLALAYAVAYITFLLSASVWIFNKKEI